MPALAATREHQRSMVALRAVTYSDVTQLWALLDMAKLDASFPLFAAATLRLVQARRQTATTLAKSYLSTVRRQAGADGQTPVVPVPPVPVDAVLVALRYSSVVSVKVAMSRGTDLGLASRNALVRTMGTVDKFVGDGAREWIRATLEADPAAQGWRRRTLGTCDFCAGLAAEENVESGDADFERHPHCGCVPEPTYGPQPHEAAVENFLQVADQLSGKALEDQLEAVRGFIANPASDSQAAANLREGLARFEARRAEAAARAPLSFNTSREYRQWADEVWAGPEGYADDELLALRDYTDQGYDAINGKLRKAKKPWGQASTDKRIKAMDSAIERAAAVPENIVTTRNAPLRAFGVKTTTFDPEALVGKEFVEHGFMSTSVNRVGAMQGEVRMFINTPAGSKGIYVSGNGGKRSSKIISSYGGGESELIMARGSRFKVTSIKRVGQQWHVACDLLQG